MRFSQLSEVNIPTRYQNYIDQQLERPDLWGGSLQAIVMTSIRRWNSGIGIYAASRLAEHKGLDYILFREADRDFGFIVSAERDRDNRPTFMGREQDVDDELYIALITEQAENEMLPPWYVGEWRATLRDKEDKTPREQGQLEAANIQHNRRYEETNIQVTFGDGNGGNNGDDTVVVSELPPNEGGDGVEREAPAGSLATFAGSGKGGLFDDPDEKDAIRELQTFLVDLGLDVGRNGPDEIYGPRTVQAVKDFQNFATEHLGYDLLNSNGQPDGDAGPKTIPAIIEVRNDLGEIQRLVLQLRRSRTDDGLIIVKLKSNLSKLLEQVLLEDDQSDLQALIDKYEEFLSNFPEATINKSVGVGQPSIIDQARQLLNPNAQDGDPNAQDGEINLDTYQVASADRQDALEGALRNKIILSSESGPDLYIDRSSPMDHTVEYTVGPNGEKQSAEFPDSLLDQVDAEVERRGREEGSPEVSNDTVQDLTRFTRENSGLEITPEMLEDVTQEDILEVIDALYQQAQPLLRRHLNDSIDYTNLESLLETVLVEELSGTEAVELQRLLRNLQVLRDQYRAKGGDMMGNTIIDVDTFLQNAPDVFKDIENIDPATWGQADAEPVVADPNEGFVEWTDLPDTSRLPEGYKLYVKRGTPAVFRWGKGEEINQTDYSTWPQALEAAQADAEENAPQGTQWPAPFNTDPWPEEFNQTGNTIKGTDLIAADSGDLVETRWIVNIQQRTVSRLFETALDAPVTYTNLRYRGSDVKANNGEQLYTLADYENLFLAINDIDGFEELDPAEYGNDITDNIFAYWGTYLDLNETQRFLESIDISPFGLGELREIKSYFDELVNAMRLGGRQLRINGITNLRPPGNIPTESTARIQAWIAETLDPKLQELENAESQAAAERERAEAATLAAGKARQIWSLLDGWTTAQEHARLETIITSIENVEQYNATNTAFVNLPDNRAKESIIDMFNAEGVGVGFLRNDMRRIKSHLQSIGVNVSGLNEVTSMLKRLNSILGN